MKSSSACRDHQTEFELRFQSLSDTGRGYAFPCDSHGRVNMDGLGDKARNSYLFARALIGIELSAPFVERCAANDNMKWPVDA